MGFVLASFGHDAITTAIGLSVALLSLVFGRSLLAPRLAMAPSKSRRKRHKHNKAASTAEPSEEGREVAAPHAVPGKRPAATCESPDDGDGPDFKEGDRVEVLWQGTSWHPARITSSKALGGRRYVYAVAFDDGETMTRLSPDSLRPGKAAAWPKPADVARNTDTALPNLEDCVAYRKESVAPPPEPSRPTARVVEAVDERRSEEEDEEQEELMVNVVQSESDWKRAAPKPRKPPVSKAPKPRQQAPTASQVVAAEKNRKKRERQKQQKLAVREAMRTQL